MKHVSLTIKNGIIMNIEEARSYALSFKSATENLFLENWISFRVKGKWFMLLQLDAPEPRIAIKLPPEEGLLLREQYEGITPAYHMNKMHWNNIYLQKIPDKLAKELILKSYSIVVKHLSQKMRDEL